MRDKLQKLQGEVDIGKIGVSRPWKGADVEILHIAPDPTTGGFYPDVRFVETRFVNELSWMFQQLRDVFEECESYGAWKEEFFGRLGNVAVKFQSVCPEASLKELLTVVIEEAFNMAQEIVEHGGIQHLPLTFDNRIYDDFALLSDGNRYLSQSLVEERIYKYNLMDVAADEEKIPAAIEFDEPF